MKNQPDVFLHLADFSSVQNKKYALNVKTEQKYFSGTDLVLSPFSF